jgi:hypothetical protein
MIQAADDPEIAARIRELQRERGERQHVWTMADGTCSQCGKPKTSFAASIPCAGEKSGS